MEAKARESIQRMLQDLLEMEVDEFLDRSRYARRPSTTPERVFSNGHGKLRVETAFQLIDNHLRIGEGFGEVRLDGMRWSDLAPDDQMYK